MAHLLCPLLSCMPTTHPAHGGYDMSRDPKSSPHQDRYRHTLFPLFLQKPLSGGFSCRGQQQQHISALAQESPPAIRTPMPTGTPPSSHPLRGVHTPAQGTGPGCCRAQPQQPGAHPLQCTAAHGGSIPTSGTRPMALFGEEADAHGASAPGLTHPPLCHISLQSKNAHRP